MKINREPPIASSASQPIDLLLGDWIANPSRIVFAIDETRRATPQGELVIYCAIITSAGQALELLTEAAEAREQLPAECQEQGFKGRNFFEYGKQPIFSPYLRVLVEAYKKYVHRIVRLITSVPNIQAAPKSRSRRGDLRPRHGQEDRAWSRTRNAAEPSYASY